MAGQLGIGASARKPWRACAIIRNTYGGEREPVSAGARPQIYTGCPGVSSDKRGPSIVRRTSPASCARHEHPERIDSKPRSFLDPRFYDRSDSTEALARLTDSRT
ncbi:hypothetical protein KM043_003946 [Ampulex compressa]|nr:hypothetical protein KM043_003946 [Ampulex compressa]